MLESYHLLHAVLGEFESQLNHYEVAASHLRKALELTEQKAERLFLAQRLEELERRGRGMVRV